MNFRLLASQVSSADTSLIEQLIGLAQIGLPVAIIAGVICSLIFTQIDKKIGIAGAIITLCLLAAYGIFSVVLPIFSPIKFQTSPEDFYASTEAGIPTEVRLQASRRTVIVDEQTVPRPTEEALRRNYFGLKDDAAQSWRLDVLASHQVIGSLHESAIYGTEWYLREEQRIRDEAQNEPTPDKARFFFTTSQLGINPDSGHHVGDLPGVGGLDLVIHSFNDRSEARVQLMIGDEKSPPVWIRNKNFQYVSIASVGTFCIHVRSADFQVRSPWAAFNVVVF